VIERRQAIPYQATSTFPAEPTAPALARAWSLARIREVLTEAENSDLLDDTALVVSELMTNAIQAGCAYSRLELVIDGNHLRISVLDDAPGVVQPQDAAPEDSHGRGLTIVAAVSADWGVRSSAAGKEVWAELVVGRSGR
jgi:anti-sigma regulatory factor (Ser/Thr protein kinase)